ncbi:DUF2207 domain-containing protein (plasmid) [Dysgonomonadaceae bacterium zrk40]|nr:DUF2207 domain-containing protein [Dysgonomonadaceae bacterium zrk40]
MKSCSVFQTVFARRHGKADGGLLVSGKRIITAFLLVLIWLSPALARERIERFESDIAIGATGRLDITETIAIKAEGYRIEHGIFRDLPIAGRTAEGGVDPGALQVLSATLDGKPVPMRVARRSDYIRIFLGDAGTDLEPGVHTFRFAYRTGPQIENRDGHDEFYWNVTGSYWAFPIDNAAATIRLPEGAAATQVAGYTGPLGATRAEVSRGLSPDGGTVDISTYRILDPEEGLTVAVRFPKGFVSEPAAAERFRWWVRRNPGVAISAVGLGALGLIFLFVSRRIRRPGEEQASRYPVVERRKPPRGTTPAQVQYISMRRMLGHSALLATVINLGLRGLMTIVPEGKAWRIVLDKGDPGMLAPEEEALVSGVRAEGGSVLVERKNRQTLRRLYGDFARAVRTTHGRRYYAPNGRWKLAAAFLCSGLAAALALTGMDGEGWILAYGPLLPIVIGLAFAGFDARASADTFSNTAGNGMGGGLVASAGLWLVTGFFTGAFGWATALGLVATPLLFWVFAARIGQPTEEGRAREAEIAGLRLYLERVGDMRHANRSERDALPALLPFAVALNMKSEWSRAFDSVMDAGPGTINPIPFGLHPTFYDTGANGATIFGACQALSTNLTACISPNGSGSGGGFSGGGFSGGGGGGGGGGGW